MTVVYAGTDKQKATDFANFHLLRGATVVKINKTDVVELFKNGVSLDAWESGEDEDWVVVFATHDPAMILGRPPVDPD